MFRFSRLVTKMHFKAKMFNFFTSVAVFFSFNVLHLTFLRFIFSLPMLSYRFFAMLLATIFFVIMPSTALLCLASQFTQWAFSFRLHYTIPVTVLRVAQKADWLCGCPHMKWIEIINSLRIVYFLWHSHSWSHVQEVIQCSLEARL